MKNRCKKGIAFLLAIAIIFTAIEFPMKVQADSPAFPTYESAEGFIGDVTELVCEDKEIQIHTTADGQSMVLTLVFLKDGGIRLYDKENNNEMFAPAEEDIADVQMISDDGTILKAKASDSSVTVWFQYSGMSGWKLSVYKEGATEPVYILTTDDLFMNYNTKERESVSLLGNIAEGEEFIGLGERYSGLILNGQTYELWNKDCWSKGTDSYVNVPLMHSNKGYSLFFNSYYAAKADIGSTNAERYSFEFDGPDMDLYIWTGTPLENVKSYAKLTGTSATIPDWATGYWAGGTSDKYWNKDDTVDEEGNTVYNCNLVLESLLQNYQSLGTMPTAVYAESSPKKNSKMYDVSEQYGTKLLGWWHADLPWTKNENQKYTASYMSDMLGATSNIPAIKNADSSDYFYYSEGGKKWIRVDYTHRNAELLVKNNLGDTTAWTKGLDGLMIDYGEYIAVDTTFANGKTGDEMHNLQAYYYNKTMKDAWDSYNPEEGYILFARAGSAGSQQYAALFGGDQRGSFTGFRQAVQGGISAGASGFSIWGSDIGGLSPVTDHPEYQTEELYLRWLGFATFSPLMRAHGTSKNDPWDYDTEEGDTSAQDAFQKYYWLRENMRDLIYSASIQSHKDGTPMMQAMGLAFSDEAGMFSIADQYMFCNDILVAPVTEENATSRSITFPTGRWYDLLTGQEQRSYGRATTVTAQEDHTPAYVRSGAVIPMKVSDTLELTEAMTDSNSTEMLLVTPAETGETRTSTYWKSEEDSCTFTSSFDGNVQTITATKGAKPSIIKAYGTSATKVIVDGQELEQFYQMSNAATCGYYNDTENNQLICFLPSEQWETVQIVTEGIWDYQFELNQPQQDVAFLDKTFDTYHYSFKTGEKHLGPVAPSAQNESITDKYEYFTTKEYGSKSQGYLKPTNISVKNDVATLTYKQQTFVNFEAEYDMFTSNSIFGLAFGGAEGVFPVSLDGQSSNETGVVLYMSTDGRVYLGGAIQTSKTDGSSVKITSYPSGAPLNGTDHIMSAKIAAKEIPTEAYPNEESDYYTVCVRVMDGVLTVWEKNNPNKCVVIQLTSNYQGGYVSLISNQTQHGAFKAFRIRSLDNEVSYQIDFEQLDSVEEIDDSFTAYYFASTEPYEKTWDLEGDYSALGADFDSYYFATSDTPAKKGNITSQWFVDYEDGPSKYEEKYANEYLKPNHIKNTATTLLTLKNQTVEDFRAEVKYATHYTDYGIMIAPIRTLSKKSNGGLKVTVNSLGKITVGGALDQTQFEWIADNGLKATKSGSASVLGPSLTNYGYKAPATNETTLYTLVVEVADGYVTTYIKELEEAGKLKIKLLDTYQGGYISLWSTGCDQGGFDEFVLNTERVGISGRPSTHWKNVQWKNGNNGIDASYLHPNFNQSSPNNYTYLTYQRTNVYEFNTEVEIANNYTRYGVCVAPLGERYTELNGIGVYVQSSGQIHIRGAVDLADYHVSEGIEVATSSNHIYTKNELNNFAKPSNANTKDTVYTLCVSYCNGYITAYIKEYPQVKLTVATTEAYQGGVLSLFSSGKDQGGFKSWKFDTYEQDTVVWEKSSCGESITFTLRSELAYRHIASVVEYNSETFTYKSCMASSGVVADVRNTSTGNLDVYVYTEDGVCQCGDWVTLVFEATDRSGMISAQTRVSDDETNVRYTKYEQTFKGDVNSDYYLDVRDLVRIKKYEMDAATEIHEDNARLHAGVDIFTNENVSLLRKKLVTR